MKLIISEEDHQFIETIVERFDYDRLLERPDSVTDQEWAAYTNTYRADLRTEITAAMVARALKEAEVVPAVDLSTVNEIVQMLERPLDDPETTEALDRAIDKITDARAANTRLAFLDESQRIVEAVAIGAGV